MANLLVIVELVDGLPVPTSLEALGQARRIGTHLGATVYALVLRPPLPAPSADEVAEEVGRHGADRALIATSSWFSDGLRWGSCGPTIMATCLKLPPTLLLAARSEGSREVLPRVAARLGAVLLADAWIDLSPEGLVFFEGSGSEAARVDDDIEFPLVALIPGGRYPLASGGPDADLQVVDVERPVEGIVPLDLPPVRVAPLLVDGPPAAAQGSIFPGEAVASTRPAFAIGPATAVAALSAVPTEERVVIGEGAAECGWAAFAVEGAAAAVAADLGPALAAGRAR